MSQALLDVRGTLVPIKELPTSYLIGCLKRDGKADKAMFIALELKARGVEHWTIAHWLPSKCACGGRGLYRIGKKTFCKTCKDLPTSKHGMKWRHRFYEEQSKEINELRKELDYKALAQPFKKRKAIA